MYKILFLLSSFAFLTFLPEDEIEVVKGNTNEQSKYINSDNKGDLSNKEVANEKYKEVHKIQFKERGFYQVEKMIKENEYGSTTETQVYYIKNHNYYLISTNEYTEKNIIPKSLELTSAAKIKKIPFKQN